MSSLPDMGWRESDMSTLTLPADRILFDTVAAILFERSKLEEANGDEYILESLDRAFDGMGNFSK